MNQSEESCRGLIEKAKWTNQEEDSGDGIRGWNQGMESGDGIRGWNQGMESREVTGEICCRNDTGGKKMET